MAKHIKDKDKADLISKKIGDEFQALSKTVQGITYEQLFDNSNTSISKWKSKQNLALNGLKKEIATITQTEGKKLINAIKKGSNELELTDKQTNSLVKQIKAGVNYLNRAVIQGYQKNVSQISSNVKTIKSDASDILYKEIQKQIYKSNRMGVIYSVPTKDGDYKYRKWKWENYMEMKTRTDIQHEITKNMISVGDENGVVFYICSFYGDCAKDHVNYQGKIYCADNWETIAPKDRIEEIDAYIKAHGIMSVKQVTDSDPWLTTRPNCRHYFQYISIDEVLGIKNNKDLNNKRNEMNLNFNGKYQPDKYEALQQQRTNERAIRETKSQIDILKMSIANAPATIDKSELLSMNANLANLNYQLRSRQKAQVKLIKKYDNLERRYDREKPGAMVSDMRGFDEKLNKMNIPMTGQVEESTEKENDFIDYKINFKDSDIEVLEKINLYESKIKYDYSKSVDFDYKKAIVFTRERISHVSKHNKVEPYLYKVFDFINNPDEVLIDKNHPNNGRNIIKYVNDSGYLFISVRFANTKEDENVKSSIISVRYSTKIKKM